MTRTNAREIAVHFVFNLNYTECEPNAIMDARFDAEYYPVLAAVTDVYASSPDPAQMEYIRAVVNGVYDKKQELDGLIEKYAIGWKLNRISRIALAILEVAVFEILYVEDVPAGAAVNEAVELCKKYEEASAAAFVNGVLGSVVKEVGSDVSGS